MNGIFYEKQSGGLCRKHSLNGYFEKTLINENEFTNYCREFDNYMKIKFKTDNKCMNFDLINSDQNTVISYILKKNNVYSIYIPFNYVDKYLTERKQNMDFFFDMTDYIFIFNQNHIWGVRKKLNKYYKVDSLSGVSNISNINSYVKQKNIGLLIPLHKTGHIINEYKYNICKIQEYLSQNNTQLLQIRSLLKKNYDNKLLLDKLEIYIGLCVDILETLNIHSDIIRTYYEFNTEYIESKYKFEPIQKYIKSIVIKLISVKFI